MNVTKVANEVFFNPNAKRAKRKSVDVWVDKMISSRKNLEREEVVAYDDFSSILPAPRIGVIAIEDVG